VLQVRQARPEELERCLDIRREVFVGEQHVPAEIEIDGRDASCTHFLAVVDDDAIGTARLRITEDGRAKAERVAVRRAGRRSGAGALLMHALEAEARTRGHDRLVLNAQVRVVPFYERLGYTVDGPEFLEAGIPHRAMSKRLTDRRGASSPRVTRH
jgi:predicted GNAT family N-acyltransferase